MRIEEMFVKPIDRTIDGVIKVEDDDEEDLKQELEEYVVTKELARHFDDFFDSYKAGIDGTTKQNGVWISGFFGSGKSHFLKILSYLLSNKQVDGKGILEYFDEDEKIKDKVVRANIEKAANVPTDSILFNIDARADQTTREQGLVNVFLKVFNEMRGFYGNIPLVADLEEKLSTEGRYEEFKEKFEEIYGDTWEEGRNYFDFIQDDVIQTLVEMGRMSESAAERWCEKASQTYNIDIDRFVKKVNDYIKEKGNNHHVVFLVDEVGQFIGDDSQLILNLQTIQEELGKATKGKAWVIVTSQEDFDSTLAKVKRDELSKIQGRFDTLLSLTSSNVDEIIKERILKKNDVATDTLKILFETNETNIKNIIRFEDTPEMKLYQDSNEFAEVYPFVPYQFSLLSKVLTSIRKHGASGKHLSEGERSMLSLFKESAEFLKDKEEGTLVPLYVFYDAIKSFLDSSHARVINNALSNKNINPDNEEDNFAVNVLKTLFLIKYIPEMENSTVENITSLMVSNIDEDRLALENKVRDALAILVKEMLVQRHQKKYIFLTETEQEINREIERLQVDEGEVRNELFGEIFDSILPETSYKDPYLGGRYTYAYNRFLDGQTKRAANAPISVDVITPFADNYNDSMLRLQSGQAPKIFVMLPETNTDYYDELEAANKIDRYLKQNSQIKSDIYSDLRAKKLSEEKNRRANAHVALDEALKQARIFVNGGEISSKSKDIRVRLKEGVQHAVENAYYNNKYIDTAFDKEDIIQLLTQKDTQITIGSEVEPNRKAKEDLFHSIETGSGATGRISLKSIVDKYENAPYGFNQIDIAWLIASLLKEEKITLEVNKERISLMTKSAQELVKLLMSKSGNESVSLSARKHVDERKLSSARRVLYSICGDSGTGYNEEELQIVLQQKLDEKEEELRDLKNKINSNPFYPGIEEVETGLELIEKSSGLEDPEAFFSSLQEHEEDWEDFTEDIYSVTKFFEPKNKQKVYFDQAIEAINMFEETKGYLDDAETERAYNKTLEILNNSNPYGLIKNLPDLLDKIKCGIKACFDEQFVELKENVDRDKREIAVQLKDSGLEDKLSSRFEKEYDQILSNAERSGSVSRLQGFERESLNVKQRQKAEITRLLEAEKRKTTKTEVQVSEPVKPIKRRKTTLRRLIDRNDWEIENEADVTRLIDMIRNALEKELEGNKQVKITVEL